MCESEGNFWTIIDTSGVVFGCVFHAFKGIESVGTFGAMPPGNQRLQLGAKMSPPYKNWQVSRYDDV